MLLSMTGYGRATQSFDDKTINVELRSLNSKYFDIRMRIPQNYKSKEADIRRILTNKLERGKIDFVLEVNSVLGEEGFALNVPLFKLYHKELSKLSKELGIKEGDTVQAILRLPNVVANVEGELDEEEWKAVSTAMAEAIKKFIAFRKSEGAAMAEDLEQRVADILAALNELPLFEEERMNKMRQRLRQNLEEFMSRDNVDENRYEQEVLFYLEKMDITEEKVRLEQHCHYFREQLRAETTQKGRKLSFIGQEIGREINTLGAKAYSSDIQRLVVQMKDDLEKIKEQVANVV